MVAAAKRVSPGITGLLCLAAGITLNGCDRDPLAEARSADTRGAAAEAVDGYATAALKLATEARRLDPNMVKLTTPPEWVKSTREFITWVNDATIRAAPAVTEAVEGALRWAPKRSCPTSVLQQKVIRLTEQNYAQVWESAFFPEIAPLHKEQIPLLDSARAAGQSFVRMNGNGNYDYEGLVSTRAGTKVMLFHIYPRNHVVLPLPPGEAVIIWRAVASFGQQGSWMSPYNAVSVTIPAEATQTVLELATVIDRPGTKK
jgi:hypothetical protein